MLKIIKGLFWAACGLACFVVAFVHWRHGDSDVAIWLCLGISCDLDAHFCYNSFRFDRLEGKK